MARYIRGLDSVLALQLRLMKHVQCLVRRCQVLSTGRREGQQDSGEFMVGLPNFLHPCITRKPDECNPACPICLLVYCTSRTILIHSLMHALMPVHELTTGDN